MKKIYIVYTSRHKDIVDKVFSSEKKAVDYCYRVFWFPEGEPKETIRDFDKVADVFVLE